VTVRTASAPRPERSIWSGGARLILAAVLLLLPLVHSSGLSDPFDLPKEALVCGAALLLLVCLVADAARRGAGFLPRAGRTLPAAALVLLGAAGIAAARSASPGLAASALLTLAALLILAASVPLAAPRPRDALLLLVAAVTGMALAAIASLAQIFRPGFNLAIGDLSLVPPAPAGGTLGDPGLLAQALLVALPLGVGAAALLSGPLRLALGGAIGLFAAALLYGGRPEGWIGAGGVVAVLLITRIVRAVRLEDPWTDLVPEPGGPTVRAILAAGAVVALALAAARLPGMGTGTVPPAPLTQVGLLAPTTGDVEIDRAAGTRGSLALIGRHPLGTGPGTWRHAVLEVAWTAVPSSPFTLSHQAVHAGQSWIEAGAELGLVAGAALVLLLAILLARAVRTFRRDRDGWGTIAATAFATILAAGFVACLGSPFQEVAPAGLVAFACGLALAAYRQAVGADPGDAIASGPERLAARAAGVAVLVGFGAGCALLLPARVAAARLTLAAQGRLAAGDARSAVQILSLPAARAAADHLPHALRGQAALRIGAYQEASDAFGDTLRRSPSYVSAYLGRAAAEEMLGHYDRAAEDLDAALVIWPGSYDILMARGRLNARRGRPEQAVADYQEAGKAGPKAGDPWFALGEILLRRGDTDRAIEAFHLCLQKNPRFPHINLSLAAAYEKRGMNDMALAHLQREASIDDRAVEPRLRLANLFHAEGRDCDARDALMVARDLETDPERRATILGLIDRMEPRCRQEKNSRR
jgi:tetratricopeptide (TPR) repeat protein